MNVERLAVNKVSDMISRCPHLEPYFDVNDKTPLTDGHIDIHTSPEKHTKENFHGRVSVQIKGRSGAKKLSAFAIKRTDLNGYLKDSGVFYLVVTIEKKSNRRTVYYALLNPFKIKRILQTMKTGQKEVSVSLKRLPHDPARIENILTLAYQTRSESAATGWDSTLSERIREFTLHTDHNWDMDSPILLRGTDLDYSLVAKTEGGMSVPVDWEVSITPASYVGERTDLVVCSGGHCFQNPIRRRVDKGSVELQLSEGLKLRFNDLSDPRTGSVSLTLRDSLAGRLKDIGFLLACLDDSGFTINDRKVDHDADSVNGEDGLRAHYDYLNRLNELLSKLDIDVDLISVKEITPKQSDQLAGLYGPLVQGNEFFSGEIEHAGRILQPFGPWNIELLCLNGSQEGKWKCFDLFDPDIGQHFAMSVESEPDKFDSFLVTPYETLDAEKIPYTLNLHLPGIVNAYAALPATPKTFALANLMVLKLIRASDQVEERSGEFLKAAAALNEWLILKEGDKPRHLINRWQIVARVGNLSIEDRQGIRKLKRAASRKEITDASQIEASCSILLEDAEDVEFCLQQLDESELDALRSWPIWTLWMPEIQKSPALES